MGTDTGELLVVDAANVVGSRPDGWWRDRAGAARRLLDGLHRAHLPAEVIVVLEGAANAAADGAPDRAGLRVVTARGSGDDAIVEVVDAAMRRGAAPITVVTADRELRTRVEALGAETVGPRWLLDRLAPGDSSAST
ncbi:PIN domain-containing protein [Nocardia bovistercoris]|uniref:NYN domain-containing protein n=1 Tax=Nocardia bovistercoris TaxID=2785916 RepID=A0A931I8M5_9NOCA|nr:NYN domain-containing protein [Nocardia bovistercoris]MBH0776879.1 NYN domain-containing protein [Nocardia bovistercoris]